MLFSYRYNEKKSKILYSAAKDRIPNAIIIATFKKHFRKVLNKRQHNEEFSTLFCFSLRSLIERKKINQYRDNLLNSADAELRRPQVELLYRFFWQMAETSNANIIRNADYLLATNNKDNSGIVWVGPAKQRFDTGKFKLTYYFLDIEQQIGYFNYLPQEV